MRQVPYRIVSHRGKFYVERGKRESDCRGDSWISWTRDSAEQLPFDTFEHAETYVKQLIKDSAPPLVVKEYL